MASHPRIRDLVLAYRGGVHACGVDPRVKPEDDDTFLESP